LPEERVVVCSTVVEGGGVLFIVSDCVVVVVVVGAGFSTTVVHEVRTTAAIVRNGVRIISFFIVEVVPSRTNRCRFFGQMYFGRRFLDYPAGRSLLYSGGGSIIDARS
jgi:hypothetical protein